jgi:two-component system phosphate regulon sensor histidine kinase PhoR
VFGSLRFRIAAGYLLLIIAAFVALAITDSIPIAVAVAVAVAALLSVAVGGAVTGPLGRLSRAAQSLASGKLDERFEPRPPGEIGELADSFNQMAAGLEALVAAAAQERDRLAAALNSSVDAVFAVDPEGRITFANAAAERLLAREHESLVGSSFSFAMPHAEVLEALRSSRVDGRRHSTLIEQPGRKHLQVITTPIVSGGEWSVLVVVHDLTDVKRTEQVRRDFIANVSHELRTPLASLKSVIETLQEGALDDKAAALEFLARADAEVDRIVQIMEELLELSRIESGEVPMAEQPVQIGDVLARAVSRLRHQAQRQRIDLRLETAPHLPPILGDAERLERVAVNLIHNALKFTSEGGTVRVQAVFEDGSVIARVTDTGAGIAAEDLPRIFERFYKADRARSGAGTGLGLAIVKHTVEAHGGTVAVESAEGRGATFSFSFPAALLSTRTK